MKSTIWSHDAVIGAVIALVGLLLTTLINNAITAIISAKKERQEFREAATDNIRDETRLVIDRETALRDMALKTWSSVQLSMEAEIARQKQRTADANADRDDALLKVRRYEDALKDIGVTFSDLIIHEKLRQMDAAENKKP